MSEKEKKQSRTTNEKPVKIPLEFEDTLAALLQVKPEDKVESKQNKNKYNKKLMINS